MMAKWERIRISILKWWVYVILPVLGLLGLHGYRPMESRQHLSYFIITGAVFLFMYVIARLFLSVHPDWYLKLGDKYYRRDEVDLASKFTLGIGLSMLAHAIGLSQLWQFNEVLDAGSYFFGVFSTSIVSHKRLMSTHKLSGLYADSSKRFEVLIPKKWVARRTADSLQMRQRWRLWPNMELVIIDRVTRKTVPQTKECVARMIAEAADEKLWDREIIVAELPAYEIAYRHPPHIGSLEFCKVSVIRGDVEYLFQICSEYLSVDKSILAAVVQSFRFIEPRRASG